MLSPGALPGDALQRGSFSGNGHIQLYSKVRIQKICPESRNPAIRQAKKLGSPDSGLRDNLANWGFAWNPGNGILNNVRIGIPVDLFLCLRPTVVSTVSFARKNKSIESKFRTLELFPLHMFLAAKVPASIRAVS